MDGYNALLTLCQRYQSNEFGFIEFRERLQTVLLPDNPENKRVEEIYSRALSQLDDIEYCYTSQAPDDVGRSLADEIINTIVSCEKF